MKNQDYDELYEDDCSDEMTVSAALASQMNSAPWYVSSTAFHALILLILLILPTPERPVEPQRVIIETELIEEIEEEELEEFVIDEEEIEVVSEEFVPDQPVIDAEEVQISEDISVEETEVVRPIGDPDEISNVDIDMGAPALIGIGNSGGNSGGGKFGFRTGGGKRRALGCNGGGAKTESAVDAALKWLAVHQELDGSWDSTKYGGASGSKSGKPHIEADIGVTGLALLAFLGAGNSSTFGTYRKNVQLATEWLLKQQQPNGQVGPIYRYQAGVGMLALAEAYGMSGGYALEKAAQKAVDHACQTQCPSGGWDYDPNSQRVDLSVAGWWIMGLKSAKVAGLKVNPDTLLKALEFVDAATEGDAYKAGKSIYAIKGASSVADVKNGDHNGSERMTAVSLCCLQFLGRDRGSGKVQGTAELTMKNLPATPQKLDFYLWYYQALGLFQVGVKSGYWQQFNPLMKENVLASQITTGTYEQEKGSWPPEIEYHGEAWGRVGCTALGALMLEVYYRYKLL